MLQVSDRLLVTGDEEGEMKVWSTGTGGHIPCTVPCVCV